MSNLKPICVDCQRYYRPSRNGVWFLEGMPLHNGVHPGKMEAHKWKPYKLWRGDEWQCPDCGSTIIVGVARIPVSEHYLPDFNDKVEAAKPYIQVNDC